MRMTLDTRLLGQTYNFVHKILIGFVSQTFISGKTDRKITTDAVVYYLADAVLHIQSLNILQSWTSSA